MKKEKLFSKLRGAIVEDGLTIPDLAWKIGVSGSHLGDVLCGRSEPRLGECYAMLDALGKDHSTLSEYFPKGGRT